jgi:hypothetical protein
VNLYKISHSRLFDELPKSIQTCDAMSLNFGEHHILDAKFMDDEYLLALLKHGDEGLETIYLIQVPYRQQGATPNLEYKPVQGSLKDMNLIKGACPKIQREYDFLNPTQLPNEYLKQKFEHEDSFKPINLVVTGRKNRRVCVLLGKDQRQVKIYSLDPFYEEGQVGNERDSDEEMEE